MNPESNIGGQFTSLWSKKGKEVKNYEIKNKLKHMRKDSLLQWLWKVRSWRLHLCIVDSALWGDPENVRRPGWADEMISPMFKCINHSTGNFVLPKECLLKMKLDAIHCLLLTSEFSCCSGICLLCQHIHIYFVSDVDLTFIYILCWEKPWYECSESNNYQIIPALSEHWKMYISKPC